MIANLFTVELGNYTSVILIYMRREADTYCLGLLTRIGKNRYRCVQQAHAYTQPDLQAP